MGSNWRDIIYEKYAEVLDIPEFEELENFCYGFLDLLPFEEDRIEKFLETGIMQITVKDVVNCARHYDEV